MGSSAQRLHAEMIYSQAKGEFKKSENLVKLMQIALQNSLAVDKPIIPTSNLFIISNLDSINEFIAKAKASNPIIAQINAKEKLANQAIVKEKSEWLPNLFVMGQADLANYQLSEYVPKWMVGVGLKINLFDGLKKVHKVQYAKVQKLEVQTYRDKAMLDIKTGVTKIFQELQQAVDNFESTQTSLKFADEYLRVQQKAFNEGLATSTQVTDAQMNLAKVKTEQLKAKFDLDVALAQLLELTNESENISQYSIQNK